MSAKSAKLQKEFVKTFSPTGYAAFCTEHFIWGKEFYLKNIHEVLSSGIFKGTDCIDVGCGPTIHSLALPSRYFDRLVAGDYTESNRKEVEKWLRSEPSALDPETTFIEYAAKLEGFSDPEEGRKTIEARIRDKLKSVVFCDVLDSKVLPPGVPNKYDVIISSLCLEAACPDIQSFNDALRNMSSLNRPGGGILLMGVINSPSWSVQKSHVYHSLPLSKQDVEAGLQQAGYRVLGWKQVDYTGTMPNESTTYDGVFFTFATKL